MTVWHERQGIGPGIVVLRRDWTLGVRESGDTNVSFVGINGLSVACLQSE
jgi:hypothetical protein